MTDHTKVCWYCGSKKVFPIRTWYQCDDCGATHIPSVALGPPIVEPGNVFAQGDVDKPTRRALHPTAGVASRTARARDNKALV